MNNEPDPLDPENDPEEELERLRLVNAKQAREIELLLRRKPVEVVRPPLTYDLAWFTRAFDLALDREHVLVTTISQLRREIGEYKEDIENLKQENLKNRTARPPISIAGSD